MAQYTITNLEDGPRNAVFHIAIVGTGAGDLSKITVIDPATDFNPPLDPRPSLTLTRIQNDLTGFDAWLEFDYLTSETPIWSMTGDHYADACFSEWGGLKDRSGGDGSGKLLLTTSGLGNGEHGSIVISVRK